MFKNGTNELIYKTNRVIEVENSFMVASGRVQQIKGWSPPEEEGGVSQIAGMGREAQTCLHLCLPCRKPHSEHGHSLEGAMADSALPANFWSFSFFENKNKRHQKTSILLSIGIRKLLEYVLNSTLLLLKISPKGREIQM